jgi:hypothetical protein
VDERGDQVRVVELNGQFLEDVGVAQVGLLQAVILVSFYVLYKNLQFSQIVARTPRK